MQTSQHTSSANSADTLELVGAGVRFGGIIALNSVTFAVKPREVLGLIGPNGAGKTTAVNALTGFQKLSSGSVKLSGRVLSGLSPARIARAGVARTFQAGRLFRMLTVLENVEVAGIGAGMGRRTARELAHELLAFLGLDRFTDESAGSLSHGHQQRVGIARALAMRPSFLLLDEPASGMNDEECDQLVVLIEAIPERFRCGVLLIEHNMKVVMRACPRIHVLDGGRSLAEGTPAEVRTNDAVRAAYLGKMSVAETGSAVH